MLSLFIGIFERITCFSRFEFVFKHSQDIFFVFLVYKTLEQLLDNCSPFFSIIFFWRKIYSFSVIFIYRRFTFCWFLRFEVFSFKFLVSTKTPADSRSLSRTFFIDTKGMWKITATLFWHGLSTSLLSFSR